MKGRVSRMALTEKEKQINLLVQSCRSKLHDVIRKHGQNMSFQLHQDIEELDAEIYRIRQVLKGGE